MNINDIFNGLVRYPVDAARNLPQLTAQQLNAHPAGHPNSIAWLLWHSGREVDTQLADLSGGAERWEEYRDRFNLGELGESMGYGHTPQQAGQITCENQDLLIDYLDTTLNALGDYAGSLSEAELDEVIDRSWEQPVTRGVRLLSIIDDAIVHVGQAAYAAGAVTR
ncbi:DinB family protein [Glutamicibacter sp. MNS18]|uniref:DinB family protein n=1 Tax=Glutamicibacter sp. MNS18 TaxID=2989817 RepID=UPI0022363FA9|nr:DinB family protein [Glutamicibacter sp. MNS18]MCW4464289.1 DinB family protein [Glutamicibacter sp. MNS18]